MSCSSEVIIGQVASLVSDLAGDPVCGALGRNPVKTKLLRDPLPDGRAFEEVIRSRALGNRHDVLRRQHLDGFDSGLDPATRHPIHPVFRPQDGDRERDVRLDRADQLGARRLSLLEHVTHGCASRPEPGRLRCVERGSQPTSVALVRRAPDGRRDPSASRLLRCLRHFRSRSSGSGSLQAWSIEAYAPCLAAQRFRRSRATRWCPRSRLGPAGRSAPA